MARPSVSQGGADDGLYREVFQFNHFTDHHALLKILAQNMPVGRHDCQQTMYYLAYPGNDRAVPAFQYRFEITQCIGFFVFESGGVHFFYSRKKQCITTRFFEQVDIVFDCDRVILKVFGVVELRD